MVKKLMVLGLILLIFMSVGLVGCSSQSTDEVIPEEPAIEESDGEEESEAMEVDKNLLTVDVTFPQSLVGDLTDFNEEEFLAENEGFKSAKINEDGSISVNMTKNKHKETIEELEKEIHDTFEEIVNSDETTYIKAIEYTDKFKEIKMIVDKDIYENTFDLTPLTITMTVGIYQIYSGDEYDHTIVIEDESTAEKFHRIDYPEAWDDWED